MQVFSFTDSDRQWVIQNFVEEPAEHRKIKFLSQPSLIEFWSQIKASEPGTVLVAVPQELDSKTLGKSVEDAVSGKPTCNAVIFSSGTTGAPKAVPVKYSSLLSRRKEQPPREFQGLTWGSTYSPTRMSGLQLFFQALDRGDSLVSGAESSPISKALPRMLDLGVDALSLTPSQARQITSIDRYKCHPIRVVTLGGESITQAHLNSVGNFFPHARVVQVYASSELGFVYSIDDGLEGFPASWLTGGALRLDEDGELEVLRSGEWIKSGDLFMISDGRAVFRARKSNSVLVGGVIVWPELIEKAVNSHPLVVSSRVSGESHALLGNRLVCLVQVLAEVMDTENLRQEICKDLRVKFDRPSVPSKFLFSIEPIEGQLGKIERKG